MKNILIINGHPDKESFCSALAERYKMGATATGVSCILINLIDLDFNPILTHGYRKISPLELDLMKAQQDIVAANNLVFVYPTWRGTYPALVKRIFRSGFSSRLCF